MDRAAAEHPPRVRALHLLPLVAVVMLALWPLTTFEFVRWGDERNLSRNPAMTPPTRATVVTSWDPRRSQEGPYIPVTRTLWAALAAVAYGPAEAGPALDPLLFHAVNLLLHALAAMVVYVLLLRLVAHAWAAWVGAVLFALHPLQVEPVAWASGMKDVLSGLLSLVAVWLYVEHVRRRGEERPRWTLFAGATVAFVLAMLAKPSAVVVPLIVTVIDVGTCRRRLRDVAALVLPWLGAAAIVAFVTVRRQPDANLDFVPPPWGRPLVALDALAFHLKQVLFPVRLGIDYGRSPAWLWRSDARFYTWLLPATLLVIVILLRNRARLAAVSAGVFVAALLPVLGLVPFAAQRYSTVADRYAYLAMLGPALFVAWIVARARGRLVVPLALACVVGFGVRSFAQTWSWQDSRELFAHTLRVNRRSFVGSVNLADVLREEVVRSLRRRDRYGADAKFDAAMSYYGVALRVRPGDPQALLGLADLIAMSDQPGDALPLYERVMSLRGASADLHVRTARVHGLRRDHARATFHLNEALRLDPGNADAKAELSKAPRGTQ